MGLGWYVNVLYPDPSVNLTYIKAASQHVGDAGDPYTGYDRFGRTVEMLWETTPGEAERDHFVWGYDRASNRTWKANLAASSGQDEHYGYDGLYQVTEADRGNLNFNLTAIGAIPDNAQTFTYDPTGNWDRFTNADDGTETLDQTRVNNQDNQITQIDGSNTGILYDRAGNATQMPPDKDGDWSKFYRLKWDAWNRLIEVKDINETVVGTYAYDGTTRRTTKTVSGTTTHFYYNDQWRPIEERIDTSTNAERQYLWGNRYRDDLVLRDRDTNGNGTLDERLYVTHNYFDPTAILDTSGNVQERYGYSAFGIRRIMAGDFSNRATSNFDWEFGFHGQFLDRETEYYNYGFRYYSPQIGRWIARDPIEEEGGENLYLNSINAPNNRIDWLGLVTLSFKDCDEGQESKIRKAIPSSENDIKNSLERLKLVGTSGGIFSKAKRADSQFKTWFGDQKHLAYVKQVFETMKSYFSGTIAFDCCETKCESIAEANNVDVERVGAYVLAGGKVEIFTCPAFWNNTDGKITHELAREAAPGKVLDKGGYGQGNAKDAAKGGTGHLNADNYKYFSQL